MARRIANYTPTMDASEWSEIEDVVREAVAAGDPAGPDQARRALTITSGFVQWCWRLGMDLDPRVLFRPARVEEFILSGNHNFSTRSLATFRSEMQKICEAYDPSLRRAVLARPSTDGLRPYTADEIDRFRLWAESQTTPTARRDSHLLLALGIGAGLCSQDLAQVQNSDVQHLDGLTIVEVHGIRARRVPVIAPWDRVVTRAANELASSGYLIAPARKRSDKNVISFVASRRAQPTERVKASRLRSTWVVEQITRGTPLDVLMDVGGFGATSGLDPYMAHVPARNADVALRWSSGAESCS